MGVIPCCCLPGYNPQNGGSPSVCIWQVVMKWHLSSRSYYRIKNKLTFNRCRICFIRSLLLEQQQICGPWNNADTHDRGNEKESLLPSFQGGILNLWICPLFQVGSASDLCRSLVRQEIQTRLAQQMEQELLVEEEEKDTNQTKRNQNDPTAPARNGGFNNNNNNKRKSKQRNKNRGRRDIMAGKKKQQYSPQSTPQRPSLCEWAEETAIDFEKERETTTTTDGRESSSSSSDDMRPPF
jgi:hypothetical protein